LDVHLCQAEQDRQPFEWRQHRQCAGLTEPEVENEASKAVVLLALQRVVPD
jgi:hypothetical protein